MTRLAQAFRLVSRPVIRVGCERQRANAVPEEWLPRSGSNRSHTEPGLQANWRFNFLLSSCLRRGGGSRRRRGRFML